MVEILNPIDIPIKRPTVCLACVTTLDGQIAMAQLSDTHPYAPGKIYLPSEEFHHGHHAITSMLSLLPSLTMPQVVGVNRKIAYYKQGTPQQEVRDTVCVFMGGFAIDPQIFIENLAVLTEATDGRVSEYKWIGLQEVVTAGNKLRNSEAVFNAIQKQQELIQLRMNNRDLTQFEPFNTVEVRDPHDTYLKQALSSPRSFDSYH